MRFPNTRRVRYRLRCIIVMLGSAVVAVAACGAAEGESESAGRHADAARAAQRPLRMLVDAYHHPPRSAGFSQGFSLAAEDFERTYFYATDATAHPNGLFMLTHAIARDFRIAVSSEPIGPDLFRRTDAYMLICPKTAAAGNPHPVAPADAEHLEQFVTSGGILILVFNSIAPPRPGADTPSSPFDIEGMNLIARRFGVEFLPTSTRSLAIPIARDHPTLFGVRGILYGGGDTIRVHPKSGAEPTVLLESNNPDVPGPVAVRVRYHRGTVLALGDAGTLGNGNHVRADVGQPATVARLFHCTLPEGPLPAYGWKEGTTLKVRLRHELALSGYPENMRCLELPLDPAARVLMRRPRALDAQAGPGERPPTASVPTPHRNRFQMARASWTLESRLEVGPFDGRAFSARWIGPHDAELTCRVTPRGEVLDPSPTASELDRWRWALLNEVFVAPLDPYAQLGDAWESPVMTPMPQVQLHPASTTRRATGRYCFEGREPCRGRSCFVIRKTVTLPLSEIRLQDLVDPQYAANFDEMAGRFREGRQVCVARTWVDETTGLPVRTVLRASAVFWWTDRREEDRFVSDHDFVVYEHRTERRRVLTIGRLLLADFD
ncbi:MAG: hypothetical protein ACC645_05535 [Pirellulales bacterium]